MTGPLTTKLRLVRCPRCRHLLQELPDVPVYKCGGCGIVLQAKKRKNDTKDTDSHVRGTDTTQKNELDHVSEDKEARSLSRVETLPSTGELLLEENSGSGQNETQDSKREKSGDINNSSEHSAELTCHGNEESLPAVMAETVVEEDKCSLKQNNRENQHEYVYCNGKQTGGVNFSGEVASSHEFRLESEESSPIAGAHSEVDENRKNDVEHASEDKVDLSLSQEETLPSTGELPLDENFGNDQSETKDSNGERSGDINNSGGLSAELTHHGNEGSSPAAMAETEIEQVKCSLEQNDGGDQNEYGHCNRKQTESVNFSDEVASSIEANHLESRESSPVAGAHSEVDGNRNCFEEDHGRNQNEISNCNGKQPGGVNFSGEVASSSELNHHHQSEESSPKAGAHIEQVENGNNQNEERSHKEKETGGVNFSGEVASSTELNDLQSGESSPVAGPHSEVNENSYCLEPDNGSTKHEYGHCNGKQTGGGNFSNEVALSTELNHLENEESSPVAAAHTEVDENRNCHGKQTGGVKLSTEVALSPELNPHHESAESSPVTGSHSEVDENRNCLEQDNGRNQCNGKQTGGAKLSDEVASSTALNHLESEESSLVAGAHREEVENRNCLERHNGRYQNEEGYHNENQPGGVNFSDEVASSTELNDLQSEESSPVAGPHSEVNEKSSCLVPDTGSNENEYGHCNEKQPGNFSDEVAKSPHGEQLEQSQKTALNRFDRVSSVENIALANSSSELSVTHRDLPKSPTTRSSCYAYDGSVSSYDGNDDNIPDEHLHLSKRKLKMADSPGTKAIDPEMQQAAWNCSPIPSEKKHYGTKGSKWRQDELVEPTRHGQPFRSRMKFESGERLSRVPFYSQEGSPSNYRRKEFECSTSLHPAKKPVNHEEENRNLQKMVFELQDRLNRTRISKGKGNGRFPLGGGKEKQIPSYYNRVEPEVEICPRRCNQGKRWPHQSRISRVPFSAEATTSRYQTDHSCFHCCPREWQSSAPLVPHICCNRSHQYTAHPRQRHYNPYSSSRSSPQHYTSSEFSLQSCDAKSDCWHNDLREAKKHSRERNHLKRHVRPVVGGAPFVICYGCSELLQLPLDFLISRRRCHQLRCSACSVILKFSLENGNHIYRYTDYTPDAVAPPPSEVDDYGPSSMCKSFSTEGEPFSVVLPLHALKRDSNGRKMSSGSSFEPMEERKRGIIFIESENKNKNPVESFAAAGPSSKISKAGKVSSEIEELPPEIGATSPLHRLMGYTSPSQVMDR